MCASLQNDTGEFFFMSKTMNRFKIWNVYKQALYSLQSVFYTPCFKSHIDWIVILASSLGNKVAKYRFFSGSDKLRKPVGSYTDIASFSFSFFVSLSMFDSPIYALLPFDCAYYRFKLELVAIFAPIALEYWRFFFKLTLIAIYRFVSNVPDNGFWRCLPLISCHAKSFNNCWSSTELLECRRDSSLSQSLHHFAGHKFEKILVRTHRVSILE